MQKVIKQWMPCATTQSGPFDPGRDLKEVSAKKHYTLGMVDYCPEHGVNVDIHHPHGRSTHPTHLELPHIPPTAYTPRNAAPCPSWPSAVPSHPPTPTLDRCNAHKRLVKAIAAKRDKQVRETAEREARKAWIRGHGLHSKGASHANRL